MKEHLKFALKIAMTLIIINAILDLADMFGFGIARSVIQSPLSVVGVKKAPATAN